MKYGKCLLAFLFVLTGLPLTTVHAQQRMIDSLLTVVKTQKDNDTNKIDNLNLVSFSLTDRGQNKLADSLARKSLELSEKMNYVKGEAGAYNSIGNVYWAISKYPEALASFEKYLSLALQTGNKKLIATAYSHVGSIYKLEGNYPESINAMLKGLKLYEETGDKKGIGAITNNLGNVYTDLGNYSLAAEYYNKSLEMEKEANNRYGLAGSYMNLGNTYSESKKYKEAIDYLNKSLAIVLELGDKFDLSDLYNDMGSIYGRMGDNETNLNYQFKALAICKEIDNKRDWANTYLYIADILTEQKKYTLAKKYFDSTLAMAKVLNVSELKMRYYCDLANYDSTLGDFNGAFENYKNYIVYRDSLQNEANTRKIVQEQMQYDFDRKQAAEKAAQDKKDAVASADKKRQTIITSGISVVLLLVLAFSGLLFSRFRVTQRQKKIIEEQKATVEQKNKEVLDSITYAKRLQDAILPPISVIEAYLPESFILYKPKDIVAGDFYWMEKVPLNPAERGISGAPPSEGAGEAVILIAAADCTGHGVPGAMVSVVCSNALNRTVKEFHTAEPGKILDKTRELVIETFSQKDTVVSNIQDGMDISLCSINTLTRELKWAGAYNSLWYYHNGEINEVEADKQPIGKLDNMKPFNTHNLKFNKGDIIYLYTDGYADQFGGDKGKKFKYRKLKQLIVDNAKLAMAEQKKILEQALEEWKGNLEQVDDILIIGIRV